MGNGGLSRGADEAGESREENWSHKFPGLRASGRKSVRRCRAVKGFKEKKVDKKKGKKKNASVSSVSSRPYQRPGGSGGKTK